MKVPNSPSGSSFVVALEGSAFDAFFQRFEYRKELGEIGHALGNKGDAKRLADPFVLGYNLVRATLLAFAFAFAAALSFRSTEFLKGLAARSAFLPLRLVGPLNVGLVNGPIEAFLGTGVV